MLQLADIRNTVATDYLTDLAQVLELVPSSKLNTAVEMLLEARTTGRRVYIMGNGGSAATASHLACDLVKTAQVAGHAPLRVLALADNASLLTAWANDRAYDQTFSEQIRAFVDPDDVVIAISASGNSPNILAGLSAASEMGARTIAMVGFDGGRAGTLADLVIHVPSEHYGLVEDTHGAIGHALTHAIRTTLLDD
jgi:D-sedoheptulose 7-phosphate isomerase